MLATDQHRSTEVRPMKDEFVNREQAETTFSSPIKAMVLTEFSCERRNGSCVTVPRGPFEI
jgi:hypothetical protein